MTPHERFLRHQRLARIQTNMHNAMARTGRGLRLFSTKTSPGQSEHRGDPFLRNRRRIRRALR